MSYSANHFVDGPPSQTGCSQSVVQPVLDFTSRHDTSQKSRRCGFTLVELMVVIVIIGLLAGAVTFSVRGYLITSKQNIARMELSKISEALETYYTLHDRYPTNEEGLVALCTPSEKFPDGILTKMPSDPWGKPYQYVSPGRGSAYEVSCLGADHQEGGTGADRDLSTRDQGEASR